MGESTSNEGSATTVGIALPNRDPPDVTRIKPTAAKRVQAHRARARMGLRCLTVRVSYRIVRHLISTGYLALESSKVKAAVAIALEACHMNRSIAGASDASPHKVERDLRDASQPPVLMSPPSPSRRTFLSTGRTVSRAASRPATLPRPLPLSAAQSRARNVPLIGMVE
jgi:hypothetical protein